MSDEHEGSDETTRAPRRRRAAPTAAPHREPACGPRVDPIFGAPHPETTHWRADRLLASGEAEALAFDAGDGIATDEWPLLELSPRALRDRWGPGAYRVRWMRLDANGHRRPMGQSRTVIVNDRHAPAPPAVAPHAPPAPPPEPYPAHDAVFRFVDAIDARAAAQAERDRAFLQAVVGTLAAPRHHDAGSGEIAAALRSLAEEQRRAREESAARFAALEERLSDLEDDDDEYDPDADPIEQAKARALNGVIDAAPGLLGAIVSAQQAKGAPPAGGGAPSS